MNYPFHVQNSIIYAFGFVVNLSFYFASKTPGDEQLFCGCDSVIMLLILNSIAGITTSMV